MSFPKLSSSDFRLRTKTSARCLLGPCVAQEKWKSVMLTMEKSFGTALPACIFPPPLPPPTHVGNAVFTGAHLPLSFTNVKWKNLYYFPASHVTSFSCPQPLSERSLTTKLPLKTVALLLILLFLVRERSEGGRGGAGKDLTPG